MATLQEEDNFIICKTQDGLMPTFGYPPNTTNESSEPGGPDHIMVGLKDLIPRWDIRTSNPCTLQYYLQTTTFATSADADLTKSLLQQAATLWNNVGCGVLFSSTNDPKLAHFDVLYNKEGNDGATAMAFFPNDVTNVHIYPEAFSDPATKKQLINSITHEFGHVLGLRHEHAATEGFAVLIGQMNKNSIMSYNRATRSLQDSDREGLKKFYGLATGSKLGGVAVTDYPPKVLKRN